MWCVWWVPFVVNTYQTKSNAFSNGQPCLFRMNPTTPIPQFRTFLKWVRIALSPGAVFSPECDINGPRWPAGGAQGIPSVIACTCSEATLICGYLHNVQCKNWLIYKEIPGPERMPRIQSGHRHKYKKVSESLLYYVLWPSGRGGILRAQAGFLSPAITYMSAIPTCLAIWAHKLLARQLTRTLDEIKLFQRPGVETTPTQDGQACQHRPTAGLLSKANRVNLVAGGFSMVLPNHTREEDRHW